MQSPIKNDPSIPSTVAVYLNGALGDLLVATAALFELIQHFGPSKQFILIGSPLWKEILLPSVWPNVTSILACHDRNFKKVTYYCADFEKKNWLETPLHYNGFIKFLKPFEITVNLNTESFRFAYRTFLARNPMRVGIHKHTAAQFLFTHFHRIEKENTQHERDRYLQIIAPLNPTQLSARISFWQQNGLPSLNLITKQTARACPTKSNVILINPTASIREKAWPADRFHELALQLQRHQPQFEIHIIGAPRETEWLQEVAQNKFKIIQPQSIRDLITVVQQASLLVANTSSMQFIASGTNTKTVIIMGAASPKRWGPLGPQAHYVKSFLPSEIGVKSSSGARSQFSLRRGNTKKKRRVYSSYIMRLFCSIDEVPGKLRACTNKKIAGKMAEVALYSAVQVDEVFNQIVRIL